MLRVLDAPAQVLLIGMRLERPLVDIQHLAIGAVADGVNAKLKIVRDGQFAACA